MRSGRTAAPPEFVRLLAHPLRWRLTAELADSDYRVRELAGLVGQPQNLVSYHLRPLREAGLVTTTRSSFDGRDSYYHLDLDRCAEALAHTGAALHPALHQDAAARRRPAAREWPEHLTVLFICTGNSSRSQMAEALLRHRTAGRLRVTSAGIRPRLRVHANTVRVLREAFGLDISDRRTRHLDTLADHRFDHVITLCDKAREACPDFPGRPRRAHWSIPDPAAAGEGDDDRAFQRIAADIDTRIRHLLPVLADTDR